MRTTDKYTLLDLVQAVRDYAANDTEVVAMVTYLINSGKVRLCGTFAGAKIDLSTSVQFLPLCPPKNCSDIAQYSTKN